jgi:4-hydroxy-tetrahydrodipicolinate synthase
MAKQKFRGIYTALVTPFKEDGEIDWASFDKLIEHQISGGVDGLVVCGTTAETPTLTQDEKDALFKRTQEITSGSIPLIVGTGTNSTKTTIEASKKAADNGADGLLVVTPYYNKPTQLGMVDHFIEVSKAVPSTSIVLYDVPGRTGVSLAVDSVKSILDQTENVVSIKDATGDLSRVTKFTKETSDDFNVLSGDDPMFFPSLCLGADGVVSVASNLIPDHMAALYSAFEKGDLAGAREIHNRLTDLFSDLFIESNPVPVKVAMKEKGIIASDKVRAPLAQIQPKNRETVLATMNKALS